MLPNILMHLTGLIQIYKHWSIISEISSISSIIIGLAFLFLICSLDLYLGTTRMIDSLILNINKIFKNKSFSKAFIMLAYGIYFLSVYSLVIDKSNSYIWVILLVSWLMISINSFYLSYKDINSIVTPLDNKL